jgi:hypothetical protein
MRASGDGEVRDRKKRERDSREDGKGPDAGGDEASARTEAWERVDQTMQEATTDGAEPDSAGGCAPMEGVEAMFRSVAPPVSIQSCNLPSEVFGC